MKRELRCEWCNCLLWRPHVPGCPMRHGKQLGFAFMEKLDRCPHVLTVVGVCDACRRLVTPKEERRDG